MGAHHAHETAHAHLGRVAGRSVLTASAALALTGAGAGGALAHDGTEPVTDVDTVSDASGATPPGLCDVFGEVEDSVPTDAGGLALPGLGDLSGGSCSEDTDGSDRAGSSDLDDPDFPFGTSQDRGDTRDSSVDRNGDDAQPASPSSPEPSSDSADGRPDSAADSTGRESSPAPSAPSPAPSGGPPAPADAPAAPADPADAPPAPGEVKTLQIPDRDAMR